MAAVDPSTIVAKVPAKHDLIRTHWLGGRVDDMVPAKEFYKSIFGMQEIRFFHWSNPTRTSVSLQFGETVEEAKQQMTVAFGVSYWPDDVPEDPIPRLVLNVSQLDVYKARIIEKGGKIVSGPVVNERGIAVTLFKDPFGNTVELNSLPPGRPIKGRAPTVEVGGVRIPVTDLDKTIEFYRKMFSLQEVARYGAADFPEVVLKVGRTTEDARNSQSTPLLLRKVDKFVLPALYEPITSQVVLNIDNIDEMLAKADWSGGRMFEASQIRPSGNFVGRIQDPSGNIMELLCPPRT